MPSMATSTTSPDFMAPHPVAFLRMMSRGIRSYRKVLHEEGDAENHVRKRGLLSISRPFRRVRRTRVAGSSWWHTVQRERYETLGAVSCPARCRAALGNAVRQVYPRMACAASSNETRRSAADHHGSFRNHLLSDTGMMMGSGR
jgi:hypothetical protein